jgi:transcriptional regulator with XRE-family HTH domain
MLHVQADTLIRNARTAAGLTQAQLARRLGTSQPAIVKLERPGANPTVRTLDRVLRATGHHLELSAPASAAGVDESQLLERLRLTPAQRLAAFQSSQRNLARLSQRARRVGSGPH